jgi:hypothetical protein
MTCRAELDEAGEQVTVVFFSLCNSVVNYSAVTAPATKLWQCGGIRQQTNPILSVKNSHTRWYIIYMGNTKIQIRFCSV